MSDREQLQMQPLEKADAADLSEKSIGLLPETTPTFTTRRGAVWTGDALDLLKAMPGESVDLAVTSPPYALEFKKEYGNEPQDKYVGCAAPQRLDCHGLRSATPRSRGSLGTGLRKPSVMRELACPLG